MQSIVCGRFLPKLSNVECLKWRLKLLIAANKTLAGYILWVVLCPSCWWGDWGVIIAALTAPWLAGGGRLLSSGRHLDNRQVTTCCKPRAGPGIGWDQARLATAGNYQPGPGDGCQENMSSLQTSSQYFHILALLYRLRGLNTFRPELVIYISGRGPSAIHFWCHNKWTCHVTPFSLKLHWAAKPRPGIISVHYFVANISHFIFCGWNPLTNVLCYKQHLGF